MERTTRHNIGFPAELVERVKRLTRPAGNSAAGWIRNVVLREVERTEALQQSARAARTDATQNGHVHE